MKTFHIEKFIRCFDKHPEILSDFFGSLDGENPIPGENPSIEQIVERLADAEAEEALQKLMRAHSMSDDQGHDLLVRCSQDAGFNPPDLLNLPAECLSLKLLTEKEKCFIEAEDLHTVTSAESLRVYRGQAHIEPKVTQTAIDEITEIIRKECKTKIGSDRILVRHHVTEGLVSIVVYYEKRTKTDLILDGPSARPIVATHVYRPAEQDFLQFDPSTRQLAVHSVRGRHDAVLRKGFAQHVLGNLGYFEVPSANQMIDLSAIAKPGFKMETDERQTAVITLLEFDVLNEPHEPRFMVDAADVIDSMRRLNQLSVLPRSSFRRAVIRIPFPGKSPKKVELRAPNKLTYSKNTHGQDVLRYLNRWGLMKF